MKLLANVFVICVAALGLNACFDHDVVSSNINISSGNNDSRQVSGSVVQPNNSQQPVGRVLARTTQVALANTGGCTNVPEGYSPLANQTVEFLSVSGSVLATAITNACGFFDTTIPETVTQARIRSSGSRPILADVDVFDGGDGSLVSLTSSDASYQIASIQATDANSIAFSVTDSKTNKAVLGIPDSAFKLSVNGEDVLITNIQSASGTNDPASIGLVLDSSGSMNLAISDENGDVRDEGGNIYTRDRVAALASHTFINGIGSNDQMNIVVFASDILSMNGAFLNSLEFLPEPMVAAQGIRTGFPLVQLDTQEFFQDRRQLRFFIDYYNSSSKLHNKFNPDERHPLNPVIDKFPVGNKIPSGLTALYDGVSTSISNLNANSTNTRKIIVAMSDGGDNSSTKAIDEVIAEAVQANIPVYTVSYENSVTGTQRMEKIAAETNATSFVVKGIDLTGAFTNIQTSISFQYLADFINRLESGATVELTMTYSGETVTRTFTR